MTQSIHREYSRPSSRWFVWSAMLGALLVLCFHSIADAHATLLSSQPAAGATLSAAPGRIRLLFSEPMEPTLCTIAIVGSDGRPISLAVSTDPHDVHALIAPVSLSANGEYRVVWHVISADGHPVGGNFLFAVGAPGAPPPTPTVPATAITWGPEILGAPLIPAILRGLGVGFLMAEAGLLLFIVRFQADLRSRPVRVALMASVCAPLLLGGHFAAWLLNASPTHHLDTAWMSSMMDSTVGRVELWRTLLALLPLWGLALARRPKLSLILTLPALVASAGVGHAAAVHPLFSIPFKALHLMAVAAWLGGLLWLVVRERGGGAMMISEALDVSTLALVAVIVVAISGVIQTLLLVPLAGLVSPYGAVVGAKVCGLLILVAFGAKHRFRVIPRLEAEQGSEAMATSFRVSLTREIVVVWVVILLGGFLAYLSPPAAMTHTSAAAIPESS